MKLPGSAVAPALSHALPPAQEAAVLYADGRESEAADLLIRTLQGAEPGDDHRELWYMLFDLLRGRGDWNRYQQLSERFTATFAVAAPQWHNEEDMARLPAELRPGHFMLLFEIVLKGLVYGSMYALMSVGLTLVYGLLRILHIAHAGIFTLGAFLGVVVTNATGSLTLGFR